MKYIEYFYNNNGFRDVFFKDVLNSFNSKPIDILEVGCARDLNLYARNSDGWSTVFWSEYIKNNGGTLSVVDASLESINNCKKLIKWDFEDGLVEFFLDDNWDHWKGFNLIFLDAGDDPNLMLNQFKKCENEAIIICDDFHAKGSRLSKYKEPDTLYTWKLGHQMAAYGISLGSKSFDYQ